MYESLSEEIDYIIDYAKLVVLETDRKKYSTYFNITEQYCEKNDILVGGTNGINLLIGDRDINKDSFFYELYADKAFDVAKGLLMELFTKTKNFTLSLKTIMKYKEFNIYVNTRLLFNIKALDNYKGVSLKKLIAPQITDGLFTFAKIKIIGGELILTHIYRMLYSPYADKIGGYKTYTEYMNLEKKIFNYTINSLEEKIVGGAESKSAQKEISLADFKEKIINNLSKNCVIIGDFAIKLKHNLNPRLQIISSDAPEIIAQIIKDATAHEATFEKNNLNLPDDFQIYKYVFYIKNNSGDPIAILDMFNSASFELIPYKHMRGTKKIGSLFVLLRFRFIDLWSLKLVYNLGVNNQYITMRVKEIIADIRYLHKQMINQEPRQLFQLTNYIGEYTNEQIMKKKNISQTYFKILYPKLIS